MLRKGFGLVVVAGCLYLRYDGLGNGAPIRLNNDSSFLQAGHVTRLSVNDEQLSSKLEDELYLSSTSFRSLITDTYLTTWNSKVKIT